MEMSSAKMDALAAGFDSESGSDFIMSLMQQQENMEENGARTVENGYEFGSMMFGDLGKLNGGELNNGVENGYTLSPDSLNTGGTNVSGGDEAEKKKRRNREAQKAFRERREAKLKELEDKLKESELHKQSLATELENLKNANTQLVEKMLNSGSGDKSVLPPVTQNESEGNFQFPSELEFYEKMVTGVHSDQKTSKTLYKDENQTQLLTVPATWEYLYSLCDVMDFDMAFVMDSLKGNEMCHGFGAAYPKYLIDQIVEKAIEKV